jgi:excisionase family DNA binding protein
MLQCRCTSGGTKEVDVIAMNEQLLTVEEVAQKIRRKPYTVREYLKNGVIPAIKLEDGTWLVKQSDVDAYLEKRMYKPEDTK